MKIFFIGSVLFSRTLLEKLLKIDNIDIVGIATKSNSTFNSDHSDLSDLAINNNICSDPKLTCMHMHIIYTAVLCTLLHIIFIAFKVCIFY